MYCLQYSFNRIIFVIDIDVNVVFFVVICIIKVNDCDYKGFVEGIVYFLEYFLCFFVKYGYIDVDFKKIKKDGFGWGNWYVFFFD